MASSSAVRQINMYETPPPRPTRSGDSVITTTMSETSSTISREVGPASREAPINQAEVLRQINIFRSQHGAGPLRWNTTCARRAQMRANHHTGPTVDYGENLARSTNKHWRDPSHACIQAMNYWQQEESRYNYDKPGLSSKTDNFTNNVWKLTTHVGFGVGRARYKGKSTFFVVAYFFPKGNQPGDFGRNVLPTGSIFDGDQHMVKLATPAPDPSSPPPLFVRVDTVSTEIKRLRSADGRFQFRITEDRNIAVEQGRRFLWQSGSKSSRSPPVSSPFRLVLQKNGDLVAYDASSRAFWSTETANCGPAPYTLSMQDDGHCVLYDGGWVARWATTIARNQ